MAFVSTGTANPTYIFFNTGTLNFGAERVVNIDNVALTIEYSLSPLYILGSIKPQNYARHTQKVSMSCKIKSFSPGTLAMVTGSSGSASPTSILTLDGQPTLQNPVATFFDNLGNEVQYQFSNAIFKSSKLTARAEDYAEFDFELEASDVTVVSQQAV